MPRPDPKISTPPEIAGNCGFCARGRVLGFYIQCLEYFDRRKMGDSCAKFVPKDKKTEKD